MRNPMRAACRLALAGWVGLAGLLLAAAQGRAATPPEKILPASTIAFLKVNDASALREAFKKSQYGQLWADPAMKAWRENFAAQLDEAGKSLKKQIGVTYQELLALPQGPGTIAIVGRDDPKMPIAFLVTADAGSKASSMSDVLTNATKQGEQSGSKVATQSFNGATLHIIQPPPDKDKKDKAQAKDAKDDGPEPPIVWTNVGSTFFLGSDVDAIKDLVAHADGRSDSVTSLESFVQARRKLDPGAQVSWFVDLGKFLKLIAQGAASGPKGNPAQAQQVQAMMQMAGLDSLKSAAGTFALSTGNFDSQTRTVISVKPPVQGLLKMFKLPVTALRPESWVPASVSSYQTWNWDLDNAYAALNELVNAIQPGMLQVIEQQLVGPNGGQPLKFQNDIFGPLGDRITLISDFKKPIKEENQRMLLAVALEDEKAFRNTLNQLITLAGGAPRKREFQGTTIYDFDIPEQAGVAANARQFKGPVSITVAKNTVFVSSEQTLLEQVLRGGGPSLADSAEYRAVAKEIPPQVSSLSFVRPEEQARLSYDMVKSGRFEQALQNAQAGGGPELRDLVKLIDKDKLPDFSIFAKYLSAGGGYGIQDEEGLNLTTFTLRKVSP